MIGDSQETILILAANPMDLTRLALDVEVREIQNALRNAKVDFDVRQQWAVRAIDLRRALLDTKPSYVHFCGHGEGAAGIVLEGSLVNGEALSGLFALFAERVKCVVLNSCFSEAQAKAIVEHVDHVIGMSEAIGDDAAIEFATAFYDALGEGKPVPFAFAYGCSAIQLAGIPEALTPRLLTRPGLIDQEPSRSRQMRRQDWDGAPQVASLYGRENAASLLRSWIVNDGCRVVLVTGIGGVGKTDLATCLSRGGLKDKDPSSPLVEGIQGEFDLVVWRSLLNAPPPGELFDDLLDFFAIHSGSTKLSPAQKIPRLLQSLTDHKVLVVLDNIEAIVRAQDSSMDYLSGYEPYGSFFEQVGKSQHHSCLLLTSREKPRAISELEGARKPVRSLHLKGVGPRETKKIFADIGTFFANEEDWTRVSELYDGNPLALELAARHVEQVFAGDLHEFLCSGRTVFADLRELLDWHLDRLSVREIEIAQWLAIERLPATLSTLTEDIVLPSSREELSSTIQALQRRIPIERVAGGRFTLQPVLIEHVTQRFIKKVAEDVSNEAEPILRAGEGRLSASLRDSRPLVPMLNNYAFVKASTQENINATQRRLILKPIADRLRLEHGEDLPRLLSEIVRLKRKAPKQDPGYTAANVLALFGDQEVDLSKLDFSGLPIWEADLHRSSLQGTNFSFTQFKNTSFRQAFGTVFVIGYSLDGDQVAVGDDNGEIRFFSTSTGELQVRCIGHSDGISALSFHPNKKTFASASYDGTIRLWNVETGDCTRVLLGHRSWVYSLAFHPNGSSLASAGEDGTCRLWDLSTGRDTVIYHDSAFLACVAFSVDGTELATGGSEKVVRFFNLDELSRPRELASHTGRIRALAFSPKGDILASGGEDYTIALWRTSDGSHLGTLTGHSAEVTSLTFTKDGELLASGSQDQTVRLWNPNQQECVRALRVAEARVWSVATSPTTRTLATGSEDGAVRIWDTQTGNCLSTWQGYSNKTWALAFGGDEHWIVSGAEDHVVRLWDAAAGQIHKELRGHGSRIWSVSWSADGKWIASGSDDKEVRIWDAATGFCKWVLLGHVDWIRGVSFSHDSRSVASAAEDGKVLVWDVDSGKCRANIRTGMARVLSAVFCEAVGSIAVGGSSDSVIIVSEHDTDQRYELNGHSSWINCVSTVAAETIATFSDDHTVRVWNLKDRTCIAVMDCESKVTCGCEWKSTVLSGSEDGVLRLWDVREQRVLAVAKTNVGPLRAVAIDPDNDIVATTGDDGAIRLWSLPDLKPATSPNILRPSRPYEGMNITGAVGITESQREALLALGAIAMPIPR